MAAMYEWMTDRGRPLPEILEAAGKLQPADRRRVEEIVQRQTDARDGDAARTPADEIGNAANHRFLCVTCAPLRPLRQMA